MLWSFMSLILFVAECNAPTLLLIQKTHSHPILQNHTAQLRPSLPLTSLHLNSKLPHPFANPFSLSS